MPDKKSLLDKYSNQAHDLFNSFSNFSGPGMEELLSRQPDSSSQTAKDKLTYKKLTQSQPSSDIEKIKNPWLRNVLEIPDAIGGDVLGTPGAIYNSFRHPMRTFIDPMQDLYRQAQSEQSQHPIRAAVHAAESGIPFAGPIAAGIQNNVENGQYGAGLGHLAALYGMSRLAGGEEPQSPLEDPRNPTFDYRQPVGGPSLVPPRTPIEKLPGVPEDFNTPSGKPSAISYLLRQAARPVKAGGNVVKMGRDIGADLDTPLPGRLGTPEPLQFPSNPAEQTVMPPNPRPDLSQLSSLKKNVFKLNPDIGKPKSMDFTDIMSQHTDPVEAGSEYSTQVAPEKFIDKTTNLVDQLYQKHTPEKPFHEMSPEERLNSILNQHTQNPIGPSASPVVSPEWESFQKQKADIQDLINRPMAYPSNFGVVTQDSLAPGKDIQIPYQAGQDVREVKGQWGDIVDALGRNAGKTVKDTGKIPNRPLPNENK